MALATWSNLPTGISVLVSRANGSTPPRMRASAVLSMSASDGISLSRAMLAAILLFGMSSSSSVTHEGRSSGVPGSPFGPLTLEAAAAVSTKPSGPRYRPPAGLAPSPPVHPLIRCTTRSPDTGAERSGLQPLSPGLPCTDRPGGP